MNFNKFARTFKFQSKYNLDSGIKKLINDLQKIKISKKSFNSMKFYRLQYLELLYQKKIINKKMEILNKL